MKLYSVILKVFECKEWVNNGVGSVSSLVIENLVVLIFCSICKICILSEFT